MKKRALLVVLILPVLAAVFQVTLLSPGHALGPLQADADGLVHLPLDEGTGTVASDASGFGNDGTLVNGAVFEANSADGSSFSVRFDGADDRIDLPPVDVDGTGLTLATWLRADSFPGPSNDPRFISKASSTSGNDHVFMLSTINAGSAVRLRARVRVGGTTTTLIAYKGDLQTAVWHHAATTYDGSTLRLYLDGVEVGSAPLSGAVDKDPTLPVAVGSQPPGAGARYFDGLLDDVRILQRALSGSEVAAIAGGNPPPSASDDAYATEEETPLVVDAVDGVLANDTDPELETLQAVLVSTVANGVLNLNNDGSFDYAPELNFSGSDSFTYRASDGSGTSNVATVTLTVNDVNDAPVAVDDSFQTQPETALAVDAARGVLANDSDPDTDTLQALLVDDVSNGVLNFNTDGSFDYTPEAGFSGDDSFTYRANDTLLDSVHTATVTISVADYAVSDTLVHLPLDDGTGTVAVDISGSGNDGALVNGAVFAADTADGSSFSARFDGADDRIDLPAVDINGTGLTLATWLKADSFPGPSSDPRLISKASSTAANDHLFMLSTIKTRSAVHLRARVRIGGTTTTLIAPAGALQTGVWYHAATTYDGAMLRLYLDGVEVASTPLSGAVDVDPSLPVAVGGQPPGAGERYFDGLLDDVRILRRALSAGEIATIAAGSGESSPPVANDDGYSTEEDTVLVADAANGVLANDTDPEGEPLQAVLAAGVSHGALQLNPDGSFEYAPDPDFSSSDSFTYQATDGSGTSNVATVTLTVNPVNDPPLVANDSYQTPFETVLVVGARDGVLANDSDPDGDPLQAVLVGHVSSGTLSLRADGSFEYTPNASFSGQDTFTYRANDAALDSVDAATVTISVAVAGANSPPQIMSGQIAFAKQIIGTGVDQTHAVLAADLNGDGFLDAVATDYVDDSVFWYENDDSGGFSTRLLDGQLDGAYPAHVADVDLDGNVDVLAAGYLADIFAWYESDGSGSFTRHNIDTAADGAHSIVTGDVDQDGDVDLLTTSQDAGNIAWYENDGGSNFTRHLIDTTATGAKRAEFADIDGDGDIDVISASFDVDEVAWHENDGNQSFTKHVITSGANGAYFVWPADLNGDGNLDVMSASQLNNTIAWYENLGGGRFNSHVIDSSAMGARTVIAADIDNDGDPDAVSASVEDDTVAWYANNGSGDFTAQGIDLAADGAYGVFTIDMDADGDLDVLSASRDAYEVALHAQIRSHQAAVEVGGTLVIDDSLLRTVDADDQAGDLLYTITEATSLGVLELSGVALPVGGTFTQDDVNNRRLVYVNGGTATSADSFSFIVQDGGENGVRPAAGTFAISVTGSNDALVHLPLDEGTGTVAADISGLGNNGTLVNGAAFEADTADGSAFSVRFDGADDRIELPPVDVAGSGLTLATWLKADTFPGPSKDPRLISKASGTAGNDHVFMLSTISAGSAVRLRARVRIGGTTTTLTALSGDLQTGVWHHAATTYDGSTLRLCLDGVDVGSMPLSGAVDVDPSLPVAVGSQPPGAGARYFDGLLDDMRILQRALSAGEIATIAGGSATSAVTSAPE